jgi:hypothetical protein
MVIASKRFLALATGLNLMAMTDRTIYTRAGISLSLLLMLSTAVLAQTDRVAESDTIDYTFKRGDSLYTVGNRYFSNTAAYAYVSQYNRIKNPRAIVPGTVIAIPRRYIKSRLLDGQILSFRGDGSLEQGGIVSKPVIGAKVTEGMILQTAEDGFMTLGLSNGSRITIPSKSRIKVAKMRELLLGGSVNFEFTLDKGRAEVSASPLKNKHDRFRVRTPIAVSAVRGTKFRVAYDAMDKPSLTEVVEGGVAVGMSSVKAAVVAEPIKAGFGASASAGGAIATEALLAAPAVLNPGRLQKDLAVTITVAPVASATGYHVQLAQDAGFIDLIAAKRTEGPSAIFKDIANGTYFVRAMAIAPSGLEGMTETNTMRRMLTVVGGEAAALEPGVFQFKWLGQGEGKRSYRFQLLRDATDNTALVDEVGLSDTAITLKGLAPGTYFWRVSVRQFSAQGISESWTSAEKVIVSAVEK